MHLGKCRRCRGHGPFKKSNGRWRCPRCACPVKEHKCRCSLLSYSATSISDTCTHSGCGETRERRPTAKEKRQIASAWKRIESKRLHVVWHDFVNATQVNGVWQLAGFGLMERAEKWAEQHRKDATVCSCDDSSFMGSDILLIDHKDAASWMGVTMVTIPQNGEPPCNVFLYPGHVDGLVQALRAAQKKHRKLRRLGKARRAKLRRTNPFIGG